MTQTLANDLIQLLRDKIPNELIVFIVSLLPVLELRGGLIAAKLLGVNLVPAFVICYLGNILPIPFILIFIRSIFNFLRNKKGFSKLIKKLEERSLRQSEKVKRWRDFGLVVFAAIPLPGTGGWTGALIAALLEMPVKKSFPLVALGVLIAGLIMSVVAYIIPGAFGL
ncbi:MAG: COG2426 family protein [Acutalibacteraceae bacterium]|jgi:uncharacterized membrane protein